MTSKQSNIIPVSISDIRDTMTYDETQDINSIIDKKQVSSTVQKSINKLSKKLKTVVILYYFNDMGINEIAEIQGCYKATVKSRLFYARNILKKELGDYFEVDTSLRKVSKRECNDNG